MQETAEMTFERHAPETEKGGRAPRGSWTVSPFFQIKLKEQKQLGWHITLLPHLNSSWDVACIQVFIRRISQKSPVVAVAGDVGGLITIVVLAVACVCGSPLRLQGGIQLGLKVGHGPEALGLVVVGVDTPYEVCCIGL